MRLRRQQLLTILAAFLLAASGTLILQANNLWNTPAATPPASASSGTVPVAVPGPAPGAAGNVTGSSTGDGGGDGRSYPGDPAREARLVEQEAERLIYVRTVASAARWRVDGLEGAYRLRTGATNTLVLPARSQPYTVADLSMLIPQSFTRQEDGAYVLSENVIVLAGATLALVAPEGPEGLDIRLESRREYFTSIVALGGSLTLAGSETADVRLTSWDSEEQAVDTTTADGRAYLRILGGHAALSRANLSNLGFWSGNTGGLSLTGSDEVGTFQGGPPTPPPITAAAADGAQVLPDEALAAWAARTQQDYSVVTASLDDVTVDGNAFGLFVSNARDIVIEDSAFRGSLVDGLVLHRAVTDARITRTTASDNAVDGFTAGSSTTRVLLKEVTAAGNGRNGISLDGRPLAEGPNAVGTAVEAYGGNRLTESTVETNGRYGVELSGGRNLDIENNTISDNEVGVVVNHGATGVGISRNVFRNQRQQAVAVRDAYASAAVHRNTITGGDTGIYVRDAKADVTANALESIANHGISLVGDVQDTTVTGNVVGGQGRTAIWTDESSGAIVTGNDLLGWAPDYTTEKVMGSFFQPLTFIWIALGAILLGTALTRKKGSMRIRSPYAERVPLTSLSRGFVVPDDGGGQRP